MHGYPWIDSDIYEEEIMDEGEVHQPPPPDPDMVVGPSSFPPPPPPPYDDFASAAAHSIFGNLDDLPGGPSYHF